MKKYKSLGMLCLGALAFTACTEDYTDWASPQAYSQEEAYQKFGITISDAAYTSGDYIMMAKLSSSESKVTGFKVNSLVAAETIPFSADEITVSGGDVLVSYKQLCKGYYAIVGNRQATTQTIKSKLDFDGMVSGEAIPFAGEASTTFSLPSLPAPNPKGYAILGDFVGCDWNASTPIWMTAVADGVYEGTVTTKGDGSNWFKFYQGDAFGDPDNFAWDAVALGCEVNGDASLNGLVVVAGDPVYDGVQTPTISGLGDFKVTLDMNKYTYTIEKILPPAPEYYIVGRQNNWSLSTMSAMYPVNASTVSYTSYFTAAWDCRVADLKQIAEGNWNNFGSKDENGTCTELIENTGHCIISPAVGYYTLTIDFQKMTYSWTPVTAGAEYTNVSLIGVGGDWNTDIDLAQVAGNADLGGNATHNWSALGVSLPAGELKFRANHAWDMNWGDGAATVVPGYVYGTAANNGPNIKIEEAGTYNIYLNDITGQYFFVKQ